MVLNVKIYELYNLLKYIRNNHNVKSMELNDENLIPTLRQFHKEYCQRISK